jgi:SNF2 family DNA or RNA helicase
MEIIVNESFLDDDGILLEKIEKKQFESSDLLKLRVEAEKLAGDTQITELTSFDLIKKNLEFHLPHQIDGALKILGDLNGSGLLADEVGLGKTITAGLVLKECLVRGLIKKALILAPPSLVTQWTIELKEKFELDFKIIEKEKDWDNANLVIASIDRVKIFDKKIIKFRHAKAHEISWDILIVDEAHKLKEKNTIRWRFVDRLQKKRFLLLTATPFQNDLFELYNLLHLLKKGHLGTIKEFRKKFLHQGNKRYPLNPKELKRKLEEVMIRRKRADTNINYMKRIPKIISVEQTEEEKIIYNNICDLLKTKYFRCSGSQINARLILFAILPKITSSSHSAMETLEKMSNNPMYHSKTRQMAFEILNDYKNLKKDSKMEKLIEIIQDLIKEEKNSKIIIFTKHPSTVNYITKRLEPFNLKITSFVGGLSREEKAERVKDFKESSQIFISTEAGTEGLNLQFCHNLINYDLPWNPMSVEQRIGRIDRIGQKHDMNIFSLATKDTMEEYVVDLIINKMCCVGLVIGELPIILFNLGFDGTNPNGQNKIEEKLMNAFIDSKNNLELFAKDVKEIETLIQSGIDEYYNCKKSTSKLLDNS